MHTTCPECTSVFRVNAEQLNAAHGQVRCGYCQTIFDALGNLEDDWKESLVNHEADNEIDAVISDHKTPQKNISPDLNLDNNEELEDLDELIHINYESEVQQEPVIGKLPDDDDEPSALAELKSSELFNRNNISDVDFIKQESFDIKRQTEALFGKLARKISTKPTEIPDIKQEDKPTKTLRAKHKNKPRKTRPIKQKKKPVEAPRIKQDDKPILPDNLNIKKEPEPLHAEVDDTPAIIRDELAAAHAEKETSYTYAWAAGIIFLTLSLLLQGLIYFKDDMAQNESFRGLVVSLCNIFSCDVPLRNDAAQGKKTMVMLSHAITRIKDQENQLRIKTIFNNSATYTQSYPVLSIKMTDDSGKTTAMRRFLPDEYLAPHIDRESGLPGKTSVEIFIDIIKPSSPVISYQFDFL